MAKICPQNIPFQSKACAWNTWIEPGRAAKSPGKPGLDAAVHNRTGSGLTAGRFRASPAACAASRAELSTLTVDKCVHDGVGRAFHAPDFMGFREYGQKMTNSIFM
jgi:hypothetical protein